MVWHLGWGTRFRLGNRIPKSAKIGWGNAFARHCVASGAVSNIWNVAAVNFSTGLKCVERVPLGIVRRQAWPHWGSILAITLSAGHLLPDARGLESFAWRVRRLSPPNLDNAPTFSSERARPQRNLVNWTLPIAHFWDASLSTDFSSFRRTHRSISTFDTLRPTFQGHSNPNWDARWASAPGRCLLRLGLSSAAPQNGSSPNSASNHDPAHFYWAILSRMKTHSRSRCYSWHLFINTCCCCYRFFLSSRTSTSPTSASQSSSSIPLVLLIAAFAGCFLARWDTADFWIPFLTCSFSVSVALGAILWNDRLAGWFGCC